MRQSRDTATAAFASAAAAGTVAACFGVWLFWRWLADTPDPPPPRGPTERGSLAEARAAGATRTVDLEGTFVPGTSARQGPDWGTWP